MSGLPAGASRFRLRAGGRPRVRRVAWHFAIEHDYEEIHFGVIPLEDARAIAEGEDFDERLRHATGHHWTEVLEHPSRFVAWDPAGLQRLLPFDVTCGDDSRPLDRSEILVVALDDQPVPARAAGRLADRCCTLAQLGRRVRNPALRPRLARILSDDAATTRSRQSALEGGENALWVARVDWSGSLCDVSLRAPADGRVLAVFGYVRSIIPRLDPYCRTSEQAAARSLSWSGVYLAALSIGDVVVEWFAPEEDHDRDTSRLILAPGRRNTSRAIFVA